MHNSIESNKIHKIIKQKPGQNIFPDIQTITRFFSLYDSNFDYYDKNIYGAVRKNKGNYYFFLILDIWKVQREHIHTEISQDFGLIHSSAIYSIRISPENNSIFVGEDNGCLTQYNLEYENHCRTFSNHRLQFINSILLFEDILFAGDENNVLSINLDSNKA